MSHIFKGAANSHLKSTILTQNPLNYGLSTRIRSLLSPKLHKYQIFEQQL